MLLRTQPRHPDLVNPEPTLAKHIRAWRGREPRVIPGLDPASLSVKYSKDGGYGPRMVEGTFPLPLGATTDEVERRCREALNRLVNAMAKRGFDLVTSQPPAFSSGRYPHHDLRDNVPVLDQRDYICRAWFRMRSPQPIRTELKPEWLRPIDATTLESPRSA